MSYSIHNFKIFQIKLNISLLKLLLLNIEKFFNHFIIEMNDDFEDFIKNNSLYESLLNSTIKESNSYKGKIYLSNIDELNVMKIKKKKNSKPRIKKIQKKLNMIKIQEKIFTISENQFLIMNINNNKEIKLNEKEIKENSEKLNKIIEGDTESDFFTICNFFKYENENEKENSKNFSKVWNDIIKVHFEKIFENFYNSKIDEWNWNSNYNSKVFIECKNDILKNIENEIFYFKNDQEKDLQNNLISNTFTTFNKFFKKFFKLKLEVTELINEFEKEKSKKKFKKFEDIKIIMKNFENSRKKYKNNNKFYFVKKLKKYLEENNEKYKNDELFKEIKNKFKKMKKLKFPQKKKEFRFIENTKMKSINLSKKLLKLLFLHKILKITTFFKENEQRILVEHLKNNDFDLRKKWNEENKIKFQEFLKNNTIEIKKGEKEKLFKIKMKDFMEISNEILKSNGEIFEEKENNLNFKIQNLKTNFNNFIELEKNKKEIPKKIEKNFLNLKKKIEGNEKSNDNVNLNEILNSNKKKLIELSKLILEKKIEKKKMELLSKEQILSMKYLKITRIKLILNFLNLILINLILNKKIKSIEINTNEEIIKFFLTIKNSLKIFRKKILKEIKWFKKQNNIKIKFNSKMKLEKIDDKENEKEYNEFSNKIEKNIKKIEEQKDTKNENLREMEDIVMNDKISNSDIIEEIEKIFEGKKEFLQMFKNWKLKNKKSNLKTKIIKYLKKIKKIEKKLIGKKEEVNFDDVNFEVIDDKILNGKYEELISIESKLNEIDIKQQNEKNFFEEIEKKNLNEIIDCLKKEAFDFQKKIEKKEKVFKKIENELKLLKDEKLKKKKQNIKNNIIKEINVLKMKIIISIDFFKKNEIKYDYENIKNEIQKEFEEEKQFFKKELEKMEESVKNKENSNNLLNDKIQIDKIEIDKIEIDKSDNKIEIKNIDKQNEINLKNNKEEDDKKTDQKKTEKFIYSGNIKQIFF